MILVGTKADDIKNIQVTSDEALHFVHTNDLFYIESSAKTNYNVDKIFELLLC